VPAATCLSAPVCLPDSRITYDTESDPETPDDTHEDGYDLQVSNVLAAADETYLLTKERWEREHKEDSWASARNLIA
jgi:hypothetical protein